MAALLQEGHNLLENEVKAVSGQVCVKAQVPLETDWNNVYLALYIIECGISHKMNRSDYKMLPPQRISLQNALF